MAANHVRAISRASSLMVLLIAGLAQLPARAEGPVKVRGWVNGLKAGDTAVIKLQGPRKYQTTSRHGGKWEIPAAEPGNYQVTVQHAGYTFKPSIRRIRLKQGTVQAINFRAVPRAPVKADAPGSKTSRKTYSISGRVLGLAGGITVIVKAKGPRNLEATTRPGGRFLIAQVVPGTYRLTVQDERYIFKPSELKVLIKKVDRKNVRFRAKKKRSAPVRSKAWFAGSVKGIKPGEFALVSAKGSKNYTERLNRDGNFSFKTMVPGRYKISIEVPHCTNCGYMPGDFEADIKEPGKTYVGYRIIRVGER